MYFKAITIIELVLLMTVCGSCRPSVNVNKKSNLSPPPPSLNISVFGEICENTKKICENTVTFFLNPVENNPDKPILGYKIKLWEQERKKILTFDSKSQLVEKWTTIKPLRELPKQKPTSEAVLPPDVLNATFVVKVEEDYEVRQQSFDADGEGPLSDPLGFVVHNPEPKI